MNSSYKVHFEVLINMCATWLKLILQTDSQRLILSTETIVIKKITSISQNKYLILSETFLVKFWLVFFFLIPFIILQSDILTHKFKKMAEKASGVRN